MRATSPSSCARPVDWLAAARGGLFVDCTLGLGGHAEALLDALAGAPAGRHRPRPARRSSSRARGSRPSASASSSCSRTSASSASSASAPAPADRGTSRRPRRLLAAARHARSAASASNATGRSTCAWGATGVTAADLVNRSTEADLDEIFRRVRRRAARRGGSRARSIDARAPSGRSTTTAALRQTWCGRAKRARPRRGADRSRDARLPGAAHRGQRGARRARGAARPGGRSCSTATAGWW